MIKPKGKKVCIVVSSLGGGGAERSSALLSIMLSDLGYDVYLVSVLDRIDYEFKGTLLNLGELKRKDDSVIGRINRLRIFKRFLKQNSIDVVIDSRARVQAFREFIITKFIYKLPVVYVIHNYNQKKAFTPYNWLNKMLYQNKNVVTVSKTAEKNFKQLFQLKNVCTIYNAFDFNAIKNESDKLLNINEGQYILFYGRLNDEHKNLKLLFSAYNHSNLPKQNIKLLVMGNGPDESDLKKYIQNLNIEKEVVFRDFQKNPYPLVKNSLFVILSSRYEGFPMVIPEALSLGAPVISVDCKSGPNEIIINEHNGLLVENHNVKALANAMDRMVEDKDLYLRCKTNAKASVEHLSMKTIGLQWKALLK